MTFKIAITGHRPSEFSNRSVVIDTCSDLCEYLRHHWSGDVILNLGGCIGVDQWVGTAAIKHSIPYKLYLPFPSDIQAKYWDGPQREELLRQIRFAASVDTIGQEYRKQNYIIRDFKMVDEADAVICFWTGKRSGGTFNTIKYAVKQQKLVYNCLNDLQLLTEADIRSE